MRKFQLILFLAFPLSLFAQVFKATYVCIANNTELLSSSDAVDTSVKPLLGLFLPKETKIIYEITCNDRYMEIIATIDSNQSQLKSIENSSRMIIDLKSKIAFDYYSRTHKRVITSKVRDSINDNSFIEGKNSNYKVQFNRNLPNYLQPFLIFENSKGGITKLHTAKMDISLIKYKKSFQKFDMKKYFNHIPEISSLKDLNFIE